MIKIPTYSNFITRLQANEVFVFGSNLHGFHGAGSAGYASFGVSGNLWRKYNYNQAEIGWKGKWNVKGISEGIQYGTEGASYAIPTVTRPGARRSISPDDIKKSISTFYSFARDNPTLIFYVSYGLCSSYCGYPLTELADLFVVSSPPPNIFFSEQLGALLEYKLNNNE